MQVPICKPDSVLSPRGRVWIQPHIRTAPQQPARTSVVSALHSALHLYGYIKPGRSLSLEEGLEHPFPLHQMNVPTDEVIMFCCAQPPQDSLVHRGAALQGAAERLVSVCAVALHSGHGLPIP